MSGRHAGPPIGSQAREATAPPWHGHHRAPEHDWPAELIDPWLGRLADERWSDPEDIPGDDDAD